MRGLRYHVLEWGPPTGRPLVLHTLAAFALGLALFVTTFFLNYVALRVVKRYREAYG
mgnify:CR=1 FL=1